MNRYDQTCEWQQFPEGRARFSGGIRGWDEHGHDTFAVEIDGQVVYGEIEGAFLPNGNDYNVQVVSFGYGVQEAVGILNDGSPGRHAQGRFPSEYLVRVQSLIVRLIRAGLSFEERPSALRETPKSRFMGKVVFPNGWAVDAGAREVVI